MMGDVGSSRQPVLNVANMSCQQLSRSSEWLIVGKCTCGASDGDGDGTSTANGTVGTEGSSANSCASRVGSDFPPSPAEKLFILRRWVSDDQGDPWSPFAPGRAQDLEVGTAS